MPKSLPQDRSRLPVLFVLPPSHFCERARWGLDCARIDYEERACAVGVHAIAAKRLCGKTSLPILDTGNGAIQGSGRILDWTGIAGGDDALEARAKTRIGPLVRQYVYSAILSDKNSGVRDVLFDGVTGWQAAFGRLAWPVTRRLMIVGMNARPALTATLEEELDAELARLDAEIGLRPYFSGDSFGRADITVASLLSPLARPAALPLYQRVRLPDKVAQTLMRWAARPSLRWTVTTYERHRRAA